MEKSTDLFSTTRQRTGFTGLAHAFLKICDKKHVSQNASKTKLKHILALIRRDSYKRFLASKIYKETI